MAFLSKNNTSNTNNKNNNKKKVLLTGSRGFTGASLWKKLAANNYEVYGLVQQEPESSLEYQADITNIAEIRNILKKIRPDYVIHLAAVSFVAHSNVNAFYEVNLLGTLNLLQAVEEVGIDVKKIILASSANIYGNPEKELIDESTYPTPMNHYANSKLAMENMAKLFFNKLPIIIVRPFNYTGPGQHRNFLVPKIMESFLAKNKVIKLGNMDVTRDISDISFVVDAYVRLMEHPICSEIFNICSGRGYAIAEILESMNKIAGYKIKVEVDPQLVRENEIKKLIGSNKKLLDAVGSIPGYSLHDMLLNMYNIRSATKLC